jgi:hypothetical protein
VMMRLDAYVRFGAISVLFRESFLQSIRLIKIARNSPTCMTCDELKNVDSRIKTTFKLIGKAVFNEVTLLVSTSYAFSYNVVHIY